MMTVSRDIMNLKPARESSITALQFEYHFLKIVVSIDKNYKN